MPETTKIRPTQRGRRHQRRGSRVGGRSKGANAARPRGGEFADAHPSHKSHQERRPT
jgi:hypothetical protein